MIPDHNVFDNLSKYYKELVYIKDDYKSLTEKLIFSFDIRSITMNEYEYGNRMEFFLPEKPGSVRSSINVFQTKARNKLIEDLNMTIRELKQGIIQLNGLYGVGKSYSLADFVVKSRV